MKKVILSCTALAFAAATLVSCGENKEASTTDTTTATAPAEGEKPAETTPAPATTTAATDAPSFSNEEVNKGLAEFKTIMGEYTAALGSKDAAKIQEINTKYQTWAQTAGTWASKLKPEEMQKYTEYMTKLSQEWSAAAQNAMAK